LGCAVNTKEPEPDVADDPPKLKFGVKLNEGAVGAGVAGAVPNGGVGETKEEFPTGVPNTAGLDVPVVDKGEPNTDGAADDEDERGPFLRPPKLNVD